METKTNEVVEVRTSPALKVQNQLLGELEKVGNDLGCALTDYGKKCVLNAISGLYAQTKAMKIQIANIDPTLLRMSLQNIGYTELNCAAIPSEVYFDLRKTTRRTKEGKFEEYYIPSFKPQGAGNEKLMAKYGRDIAPNGLKPCWVIREGDEFTYPSFDGLNMTPPKWSPRSYDGRIMMVCYPVVKNDKSVEYLIATREGVKPNVVAQIRQNTMHYFKKRMSNAKGEVYEVDDEEKRNEFYLQLNSDAENNNVDALIDMYSEFVNPTYTSGGSKEAMILRKMKNNALKNYPKEYDNTIVKEAVESMFEERDESLQEQVDAVKKQDPIAKVEKEINEKPQEEETPDFDVAEEEEKQEKEEINVGPDCACSSQEVEETPVNNYEDEI